MTARKFAWGDWLDGEPIASKTLLHFRAERITEDGLAFEARIVEDATGQSGLGITVTAYYRGLELAQSEWYALDLRGFPRDPAVVDKADAIASDLLHWAKHAAHHGIRRKVEEAQEQLKQVLAIRKDMGQVELWHDTFDRAVLTLSMAHSIIGRSRGKAIPLPFRFELVRPDEVKVFDHESNLLGHILYNPKDESARAGLVYLSPLTEVAEQGELP